jgi:tetratricopeptide (TPR) repeat protein
MQATLPRRMTPPTILAAAGAACAGLAVADKMYGLVQRPFHLAVLAYALLCFLLGWAVVHGIPMRASRLVRPSFYSACIILTVLTGGLVFAWRVSADPTPVVLQSRLDRGDALLAAGRKDEALLLYREAAQQFPRSFAVLMRMGAANYQVSDFDKARRYYTRAVEVAPVESRWRALNDLGQTYWKLGRPAEAVEYYRLAREAGIPDSELVEWHYRQGWAYFDLRDYDAAIHHYQEVAAAGQTYVAASYYNIACAIAQKVRKSSDPAERRELTREAIDSLEHALEAAKDEEVRSLSAGLVGPSEQRDPELEPLRGSAEWQELVREVKKPD